MESHVINAGNTYKFLISFRFLEYTLMTRQCLFSSFLLCIYDVDSKRLIQVQIISVFNLEDSLDLSFLDRHKVV